MENLAKCRYCLHEMELCEETPISSQYGKVLLTLADLGCGVKPGSTVLDFGCGDGIGVRALRRWGFDAFGCDLRMRDTEAAVKLAALGQVSRIEDEPWGRKSPCSLYISAFQGYIYCVQIPLVWGRMDSTGMDEAGEACRGAVRPRKTGGATQLPTTTWHWPPRHRRPVRPSRADGGWNRASIPAGWPAAPHLERR